MRKTYLLNFALIFSALIILPQFSNAQRKDSDNQRFILTASSTMLGPVKVGMTAAQASKALGVPVVKEQGYDDDSCYYTSPKRGFNNDIGFMMSGRSIVRIDIFGGAHRTDRGAKIGDSEARIKNLYRGKYKISKHAYVDGHYITVRSGKYSLLFETDGKKVTSFRVGRSGPVDYIEGCS